MVDRAGVPGFVCCSRARALPLLESPTKHPAHVFSAPALPPPAADHLSQAQQCGSPGSTVSTLLRSLVSTVAAASLASCALQYKYGSAGLHRQSLAWKLVAVARSQSLALQVAAGGAGHAVKAVLREDCRLPWKLCSISEPHSNCSRPIPPHFTPTCRWR